MIFRNHEVEKLICDQPLLQSSLIYAGLLTLSLLLLRRKRGTDRSFLPVEATEQIKGFAILLVIVGHIGTHILSKGNDYIVVGDFGVALFFMLSGFGLARSYDKKSLSLRQFGFRRIPRIFVPYWITTPAILVADTLVLNRSYDVGTIVLTFFGINLSDQANFIDYVRWFITAIVFWYLAFAVFYKLIHSKRIRGALFLSTGLALFLFSYYIFPLSYACLSFPVGVVFGMNYGVLNDLTKNISTSLMGLLCLVGLMIVVMVDRVGLPLLHDILPSISIGFAKEIVLLLAGLCVILGFSFLYNFQSRFLAFAGKYSYELFLIHGVFMIKYDFILFRLPLWVSFWIYGLLALVVAWLVQKLANHVIWLIRQRSP